MIKKGGSSYTKKAWQKWIQQIDYIFFLKPKSGNCKRNEYSKSSPQLVITCTPIKKKVNSDESQSESHQWVRLIVIIYFWNTLSHLSYSLLPEQRINIQKQSFDCNVHLYIYFKLISSTFTVKHPNVWSFRQTSLLTNSFDKQKRLCVYYTFCETDSIKQRHFEWFIIWILS